MNRPTLVVRSHHQGGLRSYYPQHSLDDIIVTNCCWTKFGGNRPTLVVQSHHQGGLRSYYPQHSLDDIIVTNCCWTKFGGNRPTLVVQSHHQGGLRSYYPQHSLDDKRVTNCCWACALCAVSHTSCRVIFSAMKETCRSFCTKVRSSKGSVTRFADSFCFMIRNQVGLWIVSNGSTIAETDV